MRKLLIAVAALALLLDVSVASAARCGGHSRGCRGHRARGCNTCASAGCSTCAAASGCSGGVCALTGPGGYALADALDGNQATVVVELPADATLTVDGVATTSTSSNRVFVTPPLENGQTFHYTLSAQVVRDGQTQTVTRQVAVRAGEETRVTLEVPVAAVAVR